MILYKQKTSNKIIVFIILKIMTKHFILIKSIV